MAGWRFNHQQACAAPAPARDDLDGLKCRAPPPRSAHSRAMLDMQTVRKPQRSPDARAASSIEVCLAPGAPATPGEV